MSPWKVCAEAVQNIRQCHSAPDPYFLFFSQGRYGACWLLWPPQRLLFSEHLATELTGGEHIGVQVNVDVPHEQLREWIVNVAPIR